MNRRVEKMIPRAIEAARAHIAEDREIKLKYKGAIPAEYNGYVSSFGAAILQSGLKAAIAFNESASSGSAKDRKLLMRAVLEIIKNEKVARDASLLDYVLTDGHDTPETRRKIMDAAIALKLAIRTFELKKEDEV